MAAVHTVPGEHIYDGIKYMKLNPVHLLDATKSLKLRDDDIMVTSFPKTGTMWMYQILWRLQCAGRGEDPDATHLRDRDTGTLEFDMGRAPDHIDNMKSPRFLASHLNSYFLEAELRRTTARVISMRRNPKDTLVSYYHMYRTHEELGKYTGSFDEFMKMVKDRALVFGDYFDYYMGWWPFAKERDNIMCVSYEEMKKEPLPIIRQVSEFIGLKLDEAQLQDVVDKTSFQSMKSDQQLDWSTGHFRKGAVGGWKQYYTEEDSAGSIRKSRKNWHLSD